MRSSPPERRQTPRVPVASLVGYSNQTDGPVQAALGAALAVDLSQTGFRVRTREPLPLGRVLTFALTLGSEPHALRGRVVRGEEIEPGESYDFGVRFVELTDAARDVLAAFITGTDRG
jgi:hypothetical protein